MASNRLRRDTENRRIIILDSNALMMLFEFNIDFEEQLIRLFGRYKLVVPKAVFNELSFLKEKGKGGRRKKAKAAIDFIKKTNLEIIKSKEQGHVDDIVYNLAKEIQATVLTNDRELRKKLKKNSIEVVFLRSKNQLVIE